MIHKYIISGMHCQNCVNKLTKTLSDVQGVTSASVTLSPPEATIEMPEHISTERLNEKISTLGNYRLQIKTSEPVNAADNHISMAMGDSVSTESLRPLFVIVGYLVGGVLLRSLISKDFSIHTLMSNFMGGFFILFSLFKMLDVAGFAEGFGTYDIVAKRSKNYALAYPFIELLLGVLYLTALAPFATNLITLILMTVGSIGVAKALLEKRTIQCACLGTVLKLPMTKITLLEDTLMGVMALAALIS